jgi:c-di-GMP-related signal transduction protein
VSVAGHASSVLVARQPICDADLKVRAYELLHRGDAVDGEQATAQVLLAACGDIGLRRSRRSSAATRACRCACCGC